MYCINGGSSSDTWSIKFLGSGQRSSQKELNFPGGSHSSFLLFDLFFKTCLGFVVEKWKFLFPTGTWKMKRNKFWVGVNFMPFFFIFIFSGVCFLSLVGIAFSFVDYGMVLFGGVITDSFFLIICQCFFMESDH